MAVTSLHTCVLLYNIPKLSTAQKKLVNVYYSLGILYKKKKDFNNAVKYFLKCIGFKESIDHLKTIFYENSFET
jgi:uncharacterized protein HemY